MNRNRVFAWICLVGLGAACATLPEPKFTKAYFPKEGVFVGDVDRPYQAMGGVKAKVNFPTLDAQRDEETLCRNYYNVAANDLLEKAKKRKADAVIKVKSVTFLNTGEVETSDKPECFDDGEEGQILLEGLAVKWKSKRSKHYPASVRVEDLAPPKPAPSPQASSFAGTGPMDGVLDHPSHLRDGELALPAPGNSPEPSPAPSADSGEEKSAGEDPSSAVQIDMNDADTFEKPRTLSPGGVPTQAPARAAPTGQNAPMKHPGDPTR